MVNFCINCGTAVLADWKVCPHCGTHLPLEIESFCVGEGVNNNLNPYYIPSYEPPVAPTQPQPNVLDSQISPEVIIPSKRALSKTQIKAIIIVGVLVIAGVIIGVSFLFGMNQVRTIDYYVNNGSWPKSYTAIIPRSTYNYYSNLPHPTHSYYDEDLVIAAIESYCTPEDSDIKTLAGHILSECYDINDDEEVVNAFLSFSQGIEYLSDSTDRCQFPLETLFNSGDCEDLSVFFASLVESVGFQAILMSVEIFDDDINDWLGHVIVGVFLGFAPTHHNSGSSWYYEVEGLAYWICETTDQGWMIGQLPVPTADDMLIYSYAYVS